MVLKLSTTIHNRADWKNYGTRNARTISIDFLSETEYIANLSSQNHDHQVDVRVGRHLYFNKF